MLAWAAAAPVLAYLPWVYQRRFMLAYTIPLSALAVTALQALWRRGSAQPWFRTRRPIWSFLAVFGAGLSSLALAISTAAIMGSQPREFFDPTPVVRAADWLAGRAGPDDLALAGGVETSRLLAARAGLQVFWGHPIETLDAGRKETEVAGFFAGERDAAWLASNGVDWVLVEPDESVDPAGLSLVYDEAAVRIYLVDR